MIMMNKNVYAEKYGRTDYGASEILCRCLVTLET